MRALWTGLILFSAGALWLGAFNDQTRRGQIFDAHSGRAIEGAFVTLGDAAVTTDASGKFEIRGVGSELRVRAYGYERARADLSLANEHEPSVRLKPFAPKALYLSFYGIGDRSLRESALRLIEATELNALVIDVKGDRGRIPYKSTIPLATQVGAQELVVVKDIAGLLKSLRERGIYTIGRIVVFKDQPLASSRRDWAVKLPGGELWRDREGLAWTDPFQREVWDYNFAIAEEAARYGFDEIQFDYVRFPDARGLIFTAPSHEQSRIRTIAEFLQTARKRLLPYNVFLSAVIFGFVCWNLDDTGIGQTVDSLKPYLDYLSPMLYPSGFHAGIPGCSEPVAHPYEIVYRSLGRAKERSGLAPVRFRPWLQAFRDYAFDRRAYTGKEIMQQIRAAEDFGSNGWMLWNPRNEYSEDGLRSSGR
jgi:hypothetical protein